MRSWKHSINIKQFLGEDDSPEAVAKAARGVASEMRKIERHFADDPTFPYLVEAFDGIAQDEDSDCDEFNAELSFLYDWADANRVWLGLR